jgi:hypothetical protein
MPLNLHISCLVLLLLLLLLLLSHFQVIVKKGEKDLPGLTDEEKPRMRGPKRASKVGGVHTAACNSNTAQRAEGGAVSVLCRGGLALA